MNYHEIRTDDMLNGSGLRVVLFLSGCNHNCYKCQNPQTHDINSGKIFDILAKEKLLNELNKPYISGLTLSGGDPLLEGNLTGVLSLLKEIRGVYGDKKSIWLYTGYAGEICFFEEHTEVCNKTKIRNEIVRMCDVMVDGSYIDKLSDVNYPFAGSTNQRVIDIRKTINRGEIVVWK